MADWLVQRLPSPGLQQVTTADVPHVSLFFHFLLSGFFPPSFFSANPLGGTRVPSRGGGEQSSPAHAGRRQRRDAKVLIARRT